MENNQNPAGNPSNTNEAAKQKTRRRIGKLTADDIAAFPGATPPPVKKVEPDFTYYLVFNIPVTAPLGTPSEAAHVHDFAYQLDMQAKAKKVGEVISVGVADGVFTVVLKLGVNGPQTNHGAPAKNTFTQLKDFLGNAVQLKPGLAGKPASWKAKVNGTTIIDGVF